MEIKQEEQGNRGKFFIEMDGKEVGILTYGIAGGSRMIINHTEVGEELKGMGAGRMLVDKAIAYAQSKGWKITPLCPYAKKVMEKEEAYRELIF